MTVTMQQIVPRELIEMLTVLGRYDWLGWERSSGGDTRFVFNDATDSVMGEYQRRFQRMMLEGWVGSEYVLPSLFTSSKSLAYGPKIIFPSVEQCNALEHVDINVPMDDYRQPFPVFIMELPEDYRGEVAERYSAECPRFLQTLHDQRNGRVLMTFDVDADWSNGYSVVYGSDVTIEESLRQDGLEDSHPGFKKRSILLRIAINMGLLLTRFGAKDCGPIDATAYEKQRRNSQSKNRKKADRAKALLASTMNVIEFEQDVEFLTKRSTSVANPMANGAMKSPHWRRGHFRQQVCGVGRSERKLTFIKPCLINGQLFCGDLADTEYRLRV